MSATTAEQDLIEASLRTTRSRMDQRLNELQGKLAPGQIVEDLMDYLRGNGGGEFGRNLMASAQRNPIPAVVAGVGLAWLIASNFRPEPAAKSSAMTTTSYGSATYRPYSTTSYDREDLQSRMTAAEASVQRGTEDTDQSFGDRLQEARGNVVDVARNAQETASSFSSRVQAAFSNAMQNMTEQSHDLRDRAGDISGQMKNTVQTMGSQMSDSARNMSGQMQDTAQGLAGQVQDTAQRVGGKLGQGANSVRNSGSQAFAALAGNPVALGAIGLAAGALLGLLLPHLEQEDAALGGIAEQARNTVRDMAQAAVDQGAGVAQKVMDTARESAVAHGFTTDRSLDDVAGDIKSGNVVENAKQVAMDVLNAGEQAVKVPDKDSPKAAPPPV